MVINNKPKTIYSNYEYQEAVHEVKKDLSLTPIEAITELSKTLEKFLKDPTLQKCIIEVKFLHKTDSTTPSDDEDPLIRVIVDPRSRETRRQHRRIRHRNNWDSSHDRETTPEPETDHMQPKPTPSEITTTERRPRRRYCAMKCPRRVEKNTKRHT